MPRPETPWLEKKPQPVTANEITVPERFFNLSRHPDWAACWDQICAWANFPSLTLISPDPNVALIRVARQDLAQRIASAIDTGNPINKR